MTTPSTDRGRSTRERIVDAACDLFYQRGVAATGLNDIAAASGTGKGQLYHYFRDKPDLVLAVINAQVERTLQPQRHLLEQMSSAEELREWANQAVAAHSHDRPARCPLGALVAEVADHSDALRQALDGGFGRWRTALAAGLAGLQAQGLVRADRDPEDLAEILLCAYEGGVLVAEVRGTTRPLRLSLDAAVAAVLL
jgi:AcrR family transcriptional regulator